MRLCGGETDGGRPPPPARRSTMIAATRPLRPPSPSRSARPPGSLCETATPTPSKRHQRKWEPHKTVPVEAGPAHCPGAFAERALRVAIVGRELVGGERSCWAYIPSKTVPRPGEAVHGVASVPAREAAPRAASPRGRPHYATPTLRLPLCSCDERQIAAAASRSASDRALTSSVPWATLTAPFHP